MDRSTGDEQRSFSTRPKLSDEVYVTQERDITFHPNAYVFAGQSRARLYLGSSNLTVGGTEANFEAAVFVNAALPAGNDVPSEIDELWGQLIPDRCPATRPFDQKLLELLVCPSSGFLEQISA